MAANVQPIYTVTPDVAWGVITTANTAMDGTGTQVTVFTAGANGSYANKLRIKAAGTNVATVLRVFINNGSTNATPANNTLWDEISLAATTASNTQATQWWELPLGFALPNGYKINCAIGTTIAAGIAVTCAGGDY